MKKIGLITLSLAAFALLAIISLRYTGDARQSDTNQNAAALTKDGKNAAIGLSTQKTESLPQSDDKNSGAKENMLTQDGFAEVIGFIATGSSIKNTPSYRRFLEQASSDPALALSFITAEFDKTPAYDVMKRAHIFGALMEVSLALKEQSPGKADAFLRSSRPLIDKQLAEPEYVAMPRQAYGETELQSLLHHGPYTYRDNTLYAVTLQSKLMPVAIFREAGTPYSRAALQEIANNTSMERAVRDMAAGGPKVATAMGPMP